MSIHFPARIPARPHFEASAAPKGEGKKAVPIASDTVFTRAWPGLLAEGSRQAGTTGRPVLVSFTLRLDPLCPLDLFAQAQAMESVCSYWSVPGRRLALIGAGVASAVSGQGPERFQAVKQAWRRLLAEALIRPGDADEAPNTRGGHGRRAAMEAAGPLAVPDLQPVFGPVLLGGFAFDPRGRTARPGSADVEGGLWEGFEDGSLVLPRFLFAASDGNVRVTVNALVEAGVDHEALAAHLEDGLEALIQGAGRSAAETAAARGCHQLGGPPASSGGSGGAAVRQAAPEDDGDGDPPWSQAVAAVVEEIRLGRLEKAVLARRRRLAAPAPFAAADVLGRLEESYPGCTVFAFARNGRCFLGATPERLAALKDGTIHTMCLAGSTGRSEDPAEDLRLAAALRASRKELAEHAVVVDAITGALREICSSVETPGEPGLLRLKNVQHLYTPVAGRLRHPDSTILDVVERLHPTPAVGGTPTEAALEAIRRWEDFDRGWYAGPVGWMDARGEGEFAVAIRSALLHGRKADLFAGCGIVADSVPENEYREAALKFQPMRAALFPTAGGEAGEA